MNESTPEQERIARREEYNLTAVKAGENEPFRVEQQYNLLQIFANRITIKINT
jgi:hypothetical protein